MTKYKAAIAAGVVLLILAGAYGLNLRRQQAASLPESSGSPDQRPAADNHVDTQIKSAAAVALSDTAALDTGHVADSTSIPAPGGRLATTPPMGVDAPGRLEARLFAGTSVSVDALSEALKDTQDFDALLSELGRSSTAETLQRSRDYEAMINTSLKELASGASVHRITCGVNMCLASVNTRGKNSLREWQTMIQDIATLSMPTFTARVVPGPDGAFQNRIFFTTNPAYNSFRGSARPAPRP